MPTVQQNIELLQAAYDRVKGHCMCRAIRDEGCMIVVIYPEGDWPRGIQGVRASYGVKHSKTQALNLIYEQMESDWINSFPGKGG